MYIPVLYISKLFQLLPSDALKMRLRAPKLKKFSGGHAQDTPRLKEPPYFIGWLRACSNPKIKL